MFWAARRRHLQSKKIKKELKQQRQQTVYFCTAHDKMKETGTYGNVWNVRDEVFAFDAVGSQTISKVDSDACTHSLKATKSC